MDASRDDRIHKRCRNPVLQLFVDEGGVDGVDARPSPGHDSATTRPIARLRGACKADVRVPSLLPQPSDRRSSSVRRSDSRFLEKRDVSR